MPVMCVLVLGDSD